MTTGTPNPTQQGPSAGEQELQPNPTKHIQVDNRRRTWHRTHHFLRHNQTTHCHNHSRFCLPVHSWVFWQSFLYRGLLQQCKPLSSSRTLSSTWSAHRRVGLPAVGPLRRPVAWPLGFALLPGAFAPGRAQLPMEARAARRSISLPCHLDDQGICKQIRRSGGLTKCGSFCIPGM